MITQYDVLVRPLVTEKTNKQSSKLQQYSFAVANKATRTMVKDAIETLFDVTVDRVNIINVPAKTGRRNKSRRLLVRRAAYKKALITLAEGSKPLDMFEGVQ